MWFSFIGAVCLFVMRFVKRAIYMQVTSAPSLPKHLIIMRPLKIQIVVFLPVVEIIAQEPKKVMKLILNNYIHSSINPSTPAGTFFYKWTKISSLEIDIFDLKMMDIFDLKMMVKCGLELFCFESHRDPSKLLLPSAKKSAQKG